MTGQEGLTADVDNKAITTFRTIAMLFEPWLSFSCPGRTPPFLLHLEFWLRTNVRTTYKLSSTGCVYDAHTCFILMSELLASAIKTYSGSWWLCDANLT
jgi:hypothetical protein